MLIKNACIHEKSKLIDVVYYHIQDLHKKNQILMNFVLNQDMITNELIKSLLNHSFKRFIKQLRLKSSKS